jgi:hypothetical protein
MRIVHLNFLSLLTLLFIINFSLRVQGQQQTYNLETSTFRLIFNRFNVSGDGYATGIRECRYLPTNRTFHMNERATCIAIENDTIWNFPVTTSVSQIAPNRKELTVYFGVGRNIRMQITSHQYFLEFELLPLTDTSLVLWLFGPIFMGLSPNDWPGWDSLGMNHYEYNQITYLGSGYYACLIAANPNTNIYRNWENPTSVFITAISPKYLPTRGGASYRNQRFAFFLCREEDLKNRVREVEQYFNFPYGVELKDNPENDIDYLFLIDENYVPARNIIQLCRETNLGAVLLYQGFWSDWRNPDEPFLLQGWTENVVDSLKAAGLIVGLHSYVHLVPYDGYFAINYPNQVSTCTVEVFKVINWTTSLPDSIVHRFVAKVLILQPDWLYFDGVGPLNVENCIGSILDHYLGMRLTDAILRELRRRNYNRLKIFQEASGTLPYHFTSRIGQTDYWDNAPWHRNPIGHMNFTASQSIHRRRGLYKYTDLGWFGRDIHLCTCLACPPDCWDRRDATWDEWQHLANTSLTYNIPVGIRTTYNDFITDTLNPLIVPLLRETIRQRRNLTFIESKENLLPIFTLQQNYPNPFNPSTTIRFSIPHPTQVTLKIFDVLGREVTTLINKDLNPGEHSVVFNSRDLPSGIYFAEMKTRTVMRRIKMVLVK